MRKFENEERGGEKKKSYIVKSDGIGQFQIKYRISHSFS